MGVMRFKNRDRTPPTDPQNLTATATTSLISLGWVAASDNISVAGYNLFRDGALLAVLAGAVVSYEDPSLAAGTSYSYGLQAFDDASNVSQVVWCTKATKLPFTPSSPDFPRMATYLIGGNQHYDAPYTTRAAWFDINIIGRNLDGGSSVLPGGNRNAFVNAVKAACVMPDGTQMYQYYISDNVKKTGPASQTLADLVTANNWLLYASGISGTPLDSPFSPPQYLMTNQTSFVPADPATGLKLEARYAKHYLENYITGGGADAASAMDGLFRDNCVLKAEIAGDYNRDGTSDSIATASAWVRAGEAEAFDWFHANAPASKKILGNIGSWGDPNATYGGNDASGLIGKPDGGLIEHLMGRPSSQEYYSGFNLAKTVYQFAMANVGTAKLVCPQHSAMALDGSDLLTATPYQAWRYFFTFCLMDNGFPAWSLWTGTATDYSAANNTHWFDEMAVNPVTGVCQTLATVTVAGRKYLKQPLDGAWNSLALGTLKVWYRRYTDPSTGKLYLVLCNPRANGPQTVNVLSTFGKNFKRFIGTQAPSINNGVTSATVSLLDRDGIIGELV